MDDAWLRRRHAPAHIMADCRLRQASSARLRLRHPNILRQESQDGGEKHVPVLPVHATVGCANSAQQRLQSAAAPRSTQRAERGGRCEHAAPASRPAQESGRGGEASAARWARGCGGLGAASLVWGLLERTRTAPQAAPQERCPASGRPCRSAAVPTSSPISTSSGPAGSSTISRTSDKGSSGFLRYQQDSHRLPSSPGWLCTMPA
jgi:hypothetical protein